MEKLKASYFVDGNVKWCGHFGQQSDSSSKVKQYYHTTQQFYSMRIENIFPHKDL